MLLQVVQLSDEVTVSSLPHPISMFLLGIFAVTIIFVLIEVTRMRKEWEKNRNILNGFENRFNEHKIDTDNKIDNISKKIDSRVDKAIVSMSRRKEVL